ncbi:GntR family transcriptional regulator [Nocardioides mangrovicus]|uniref:GntR family transcriptional regulator n=1 Tax=Nocardioides mangrovicus TaxID=2478913 RepID=A0A3L8P413_9ACTN|nr:GntR family transcriptional regulator [Nocardioides mangrovicus]RLV50015.1 GntR family transcriptional regulator [Nocardioides mangrovicus]
MAAHEGSDPVLSRAVDLTAASAQPAHVRIAAWLEALIADGVVVPGDRLPSEIEMAARLGVSRMTLRQALAGVATKGLIERRRGRFGGNFVSRPRYDFDLTGLPGFTEQMRRAHVEAGARVVSARTRTPSAEVRQALRLRRGARVHEVVRVRSANGQPIALEETFLPAALFSGILNADLTGSLYAVMESRYRRPPVSADEVVEPVNAGETRAELLGVEPTTALLLLTRTAYDVAGTPVEYSHDVFRPDRTRITLHARVDAAPVALVQPTRSV